MARKQTEMRVVFSDAEFKAMCVEATRKRVGFHINPEAEFSIFINVDNEVLVVVTFPEEELQ